MLVSVLLAYALEPFVVFMRCRLPRTAAVIVVYALLAVGGVATVALAQQQVAGFLNELPHAVAAVTETLQRRSAAPSAAS